MIRAPLRSDPIAVLATAAGHGDPESWWNDMFEVGQNGADVFAAVADAMAALRKGQPTTGDDIPRKAQLRLTIAKAATGAGPLAVVCGAWHVPALRTHQPKAADHAAFRGLSSVKNRATWMPWTTRRLPRFSG